MEFRPLYLVPYGSILVLMLILPAAGAYSGLDFPGDVYCSQSSGRILSDIPDSCSVMLSRQPGSEWMTQPDWQNAVAPASMPPSQSRGTGSAWVKASSTQGDGSGVTTSLSYFQKVTATGQIEHFAFSASYES